VQDPGRQARGNVEEARDGGRNRGIASPSRGTCRSTPRSPIEGEVATIDARGIYYKHLNEAIRQCFADGVTKVELRNINGQRYIGTGIRGAEKRIEVHGTAGQDMAMFMDGPTSRSSATRRTAWATR
jgi:glutamate synthase domain-containing protein 3